MEDKSELLSIAKRDLTDVKSQEHEASGHLTIETAMRVALEKKCKDLEQENEVCYRKIKGLEIMRDTFELRITGQL